jgi:hypothetical protein
MTPSDMLVRICQEDYRATYNFICAYCGSAVFKPAERRIVDLLVSAGVELVTWNRPAELLESHAGEPIDYDDLLDFHEGLRAQDWFDELAAIVPVKQIQLEIETGRQKRIQAKAKAPVEIDTPLVQVHPIYAATKPRRRRGLLGRHRRR